MTDVLKDFDSILSDTVDEELKTIKLKCKQLYIRAISQTVYKRKENEKIYHRTYALTKSVDTEIDGNSLYIFHDINKLKYFSIVHKSLNTSEQVPFWLNYGHNGLFGHYEEQMFLELVKNLIQNELGLDVEIIVKEPPMLIY